MVQAGVDMASAVVVAQNSILSRRGCLATDKHSSRQEVLDDEDADTDATLALSTEDDLEKKSPANSYDEAVLGGGSSGGAMTRIRISKPWLC